jgi:hypothetical protein
MSLMRGDDTHPLLLSATTFCEVTGLSSRALDKAVLAKRMFSAELEGQLRFPGFFFDKRYVRRHLASVCQVLGSLPGGSKLQFFTKPKGSLGGRTPLDAPAAGDVALVRRAAQGFVER